VEVEGVSGFTVLCTVIVAGVVVGFSVGFAVVVDAAVVGGVVVVGFAGASVGGPVVKLCGVKSPTILAMLEAFVAATLCTDDPAKL
jgi:hypothetical protein